MICPFCDSEDGRVIDSRASEAGRAIRRRRQCNACGRRFTTYERIEETARILVVKGDGRREAFDPQKIQRGVEAACGKRPVPDEAKRRLVEAVEDEIHREFDREVDSGVIGQKVAARLRDLDEIAYIRFASEYEQFKSVSDIAEIIHQLSTRVRDSKHQQRLFDEAHHPAEAPAR
jgi:transcriptional repressor NrdR